MQQLVSHWGFGGPLGGGGPKQLGQKSLSHTPFKHMSVWDCLWCVVCILQRVICDLSVIQRRLVDPKKKAEVYMNARECAV